MMKKKKIDYLDTVNTLAFIVMSSMVILQVFVRYVLNISIPWTEELARYLLLSITFVGGALAIRDKQHINISIFIEKVPKKFYYYLKLCFDILIILFLIAVLRGAIIMIEVTWGTPVGSISWISSGKLYLILAASIIIMIIYSIKHFIKGIVKIIDINIKE